MVFCFFVPFILLQNTFKVTITFYPWKSLSQVEMHRQGCVYSRRTLTSLKVITSFSGTWPTLLCGVTVIIRCSLLTSSVQLPDLLTNLVGCYAWHKPNTGPIPTTTTKPHPPGTFSHFPRQIMMLLRGRIPSRLVPQINGWVLLFTHQPLNGGVNMGWLGHPILQHFRSFSGARNRPKNMSQKRRKEKANSARKHIICTRVIIAPTAPADSPADHFFHPTKHAELQTESSLKDPTPTEIDAEQCPPSTEPEF